MDDLSFSSSQSLSSSSSSSQIPLNGQHTSSAGNHHNSNNINHHQTSLFSSKSTSSIQSDFESSSSSSQPIDELKQANAQFRQYIGKIHVLSKFDDRKFSKNKTNSKNKNFRFGFIRKEWTSFKFRSLLNIFKLNLKLLEPFLWYLV